MTGPGDPLDRANTFGAPLWAVSDQPSSMPATDADPSVTDRVHDTSWSANVEQPRHAEDVDLVVEGAIDAVEHTTAGNHVNLVTHSEHGHPETYLFEALEDAFGDGVSAEYVQQCGCGGHVTRVHVH